MGILAIGFFLIKATPHVYAQINDPNLGLMVFCNNDLTATYHIINSGGDMQTEGSYSIFDPNTVITVTHSLQLGAGQSIIFNTVGNTTVNVNYSTPVLLSVSLSVTGTCIATPTATPTPTTTPQPVNNTFSNDGGDGLGCANHDCSGNRNTAGQVLGASTTGQVLGASTMAGVGSFEENLYLSIMGLGGIFSLTGIKKASKKN